MTPDQMKYQKLRDCFSAGYSLAQYCVDKGYKSPLIISYNSIFLWELCVQFWFSKSNSAASFKQFKSQENLNPVTFAEAGTMALQNFPIVNPEEDYDKYDAVILLTTNKRDFLPAHKTIYLDALLAEIKQYVYAERPIYNFLTRNKGVRVILHKHPVLHRIGELSENEHNMFVRNTHQIKSLIMQSNGERILTPYDEFGYDNEMVLKLLNLSGAETTDDGCTVLVDNPDEDIRIINGKRETKYQPQDYKNTIWCMGTCTFFGYGAPYDKTFESYLQLIVNAHGDSYMIENCSQFYGNRYQDIFYNLNALPVKDGDIVLIFLQGLSVRNVPCLDQTNIFKRPHDYGEVFADAGHVTERGYKIMADDCYSYLVKNKFFIDYDYSNIKHIVRPHIYGVPEWADSASREEAQLPQQSTQLTEFKNSLRKYRLKIGSIVMNCNPFTLGHRYLIEYAAKCVDKLFIFVVEENKSVFPFKDRLELVQNGTRDLKNVTVMPSGQFIISSLTFSDYFNKSEIQERRIDPTYDVELFGKEIAPTLGINVRFAGEEPLDKVTLQYNQTMERILPKYGIEFIVIPRKESDGAVISASRVRALLKENNFDEINKIVPHTTFVYLMDKYGKRGGG